jgi:aspartate kinase
VKIIKFGGTSLKDVAAIQNVIGILDRKLPPCIVVLSATAGTTNKFLEMIEFAASGDKERAFSLNRKLEKYHLEYIRQLGIYDNSELKNEIKNLFSNVETFLTGIFCIREAIQRVCDAIVSNGELISTKIIDAYLKSQNKKCRWFDVREIMITDNQFGSAQPDILQLQKRANQKLKPLLSDYDIIVTQGFIGMTAEGLPTTLGRGGSDYTASLIGEALDAEDIEIWTDVSGIMTADPRIIESAYTQPDLSFKEAAELAYFGARVLHPSAILPAIRKHIPVLVKNTLAQNDLGKNITP